MPVTSTLPISRLIAVSVALTAQAAQGQSLSQMLIMGSSSVIDVKTRARTYSTLAAIATDFGTSAPEYLAASLWFDQVPQPTSVMIGRWAQSATSGELVGAPINAATVLTALQAISSGGFTVTVDGGSVQHLSALDFHLITNLNGAATVITAALTGATCTWNATYNQFTITSSTTGTSSSVTFATAPLSGTDVSATLGLTVGSSGSYTQAGIAAESYVSAVTLLDQLFGMQWYGLATTGAASSDSVAISAYIEGASIYHYYFVTDQEAVCLSPSDTTSLAYQLFQVAPNKTMVQYSSTNPYAAVSAAARMLTVDYTGQNTTITLMYKQEPGVTAESLNATQIGALEQKNTNVFVAYNNNTAIVEPGQSCSGQYIDTVIGIAALAVTLQTAIYNALYQSTTKIPYTDAGNGIIQTVVESVLTQFVTDGLLAPGVWTGPSFGSIVTNEFLSKGYYVYVAPVATVTAAQRGQRLTGPFQIAAHLAGAIHKVNVAITVA